MSYHRFVFTSVSLAALTFAGASLTGCSSGGGGSMIGGEVGRAVGGKAGKNPIGGERR
jgi:hypothetical protein